MWKLLMKRRLSSSSHPWKRKNHLAALQQVERFSSYFPILRKLIDFGWLMDPRHRKEPFFKTWSEKCHLNEKSETLDIKYLKCVYWRKKFILRPLQILIFIISSSPTSGDWEGSSNFPILRKLIEIWLTYGLKTQNWKEPFHLLETKRVTIAKKEGFFVVLKWELFVSLYS